MDNYLTQYQAAQLIGISPARLQQLIAKGKFALKGKMIFNKHAQRKVLQYKRAEVEEYANQRNSTPPTPPRG